MQERKAIGKEEGRGDRVIFFKRNNEASPEIILDATFSSFPTPPKKVKKWPRKSRLSKGKGCYQLSQGWQKLRISCDSKIVYWWNEQNKTRLEWGKEQAGS